MGNQALARWPALKHMWANEKAVRALHVQFVPNRILIDKKGNIVKWWNGENGKVVDGKFGKSINNKSSKIADEIAAILDKEKEEEAVQNGKNNIYGVYTNIWIIMNK